MPQSRPAQIPCSVCGRSFRPSQIVPGVLVLDPLAELIRKSHPDWSPDAGICRPDLRRFRSEYLESLLLRERGELSELEEEVLRGMEEEGTIVARLSEEPAATLTLGQRLADRIATLGGSWRFIVGFGVVLAVWIALNTMQWVARPFDPYPFILLNLVLSCLAALQAPVIMMSQRRLEERDRSRAQNDYRINLRAELEIRMLSRRLDHLLTHQWQRLLEIQQLQLDLLEQRPGGRPPG